MTGSSWAPIVIPVVAMIALAVWLAMVFHADSHPQHGGQAVRLNPRGSSGRQGEASREEQLSGRA